MEKEIGHKIRKLRTERKITLEGLAEKTGLTIGYLSKIERGLSSLPIATLDRIATALQIQITDIFEE
ncbi:MAG: DNA-binding protein, partial [Deltaproteobacteria bacterium]